LSDGGRIISLAGPPSVTLPEGRDLSARFFIVEPERSQLMELARLVDDGRLRVEVAEVFRLENAAAAYEFGRTERRRGKVVVQVTAVSLKAKQANALGREDGDKGLELFPDES